MSQDKTTLKDRIGVSTRVSGQDGEDASVESSRIPVLTSVVPGMSPGASILPEASTSSEADIIPAPSQSARYDASKLGADLVPTQVAEVLAGQDRSKASPARYHSLLAMEAARKMRRTRQKQRTGQEVCHHLKMMLSQPLPGPTEGSVPSADENQYQLGF